MGEKVYIKRKKKVETKNEVFLKNFEEFASYWRANPHRFITDYLGLELYDFQKAIIYEMNMFQNFIYVAGRGVAKKIFN